MSDGPSRLGKPWEDFEDVFENTQHGHAILDAGGLILRANKRLASWRGVDAEELEGTRFADLLSISGKVYHETHLRPLLRMQGYFDEVALEMASFTGERLPVIISSVERRDDEGNVLYTRVTLFRAVQRKQYEDNLRQSRSNALTSLRDAQGRLAHELETGALREQFIAVLGHDLRNPLASIDAGMRLLTKKQQDPDLKMVIDLIRGSTARMAGLIDNIMDFARGRLGDGIRIDRHPILLEPVLAHVVDELRLAHPGRSIETDFALPTPVPCDPGRVSQVLSNLVANALIHGSPDGPVRVQAHLSEEEMTVSVANRGDPIPPGAMDRLFQPFTREDVRPSKQGLGLGLYISAEIARAHGGSLTVSSDDAETRFTLVIPATAPSE
jgi:sigma-B regulation protein RsbU (phosphoserine phosphatase)